MKKLSTSPVPKRPTEESSFKMHPSTTSLVILSYIAIVLCLVCAAYGTSIGSSSGSDQSLFSNGAGGGTGSAESDVGDDRGQREISQSTFQHLLAVRSPKYNFGLGKRRYIIEDVPGAKRLPHYNFGLGKRARNSLFDYDEESVPSWSDDYSSLKDGLDYDSDKDKSSAEKRSSAYRYHFGLGKRRAYDFGLGKRVYDFGLGKRAYEDKRLPNRYNFGLGKR